LKLDPRQRNTSTTDSVIVTPSATTLSEAMPAESGPVSQTDVIGLLRVTDRDAAWRDLAALLVRVGGSELGSPRDFTLLALIPQARYGEFAEGLSQIGAWQLEAGRSPLPDHVRMTIRLSP
jgi:hypothetical protein